MNKLEKGDIGKNLHCLTNYRYVCELPLTEVLTLTKLEGLALSGPLQKISNKQNLVHDYIQVNTEEHATHKMKWECH